MPGGRWGVNASVPLRRKTVIGQPALGARHLEYLTHLIIRQLEVEDGDIFGQPLDL